VGLGTYLLPTLEMAYQVHEDPLNDARRASNASEGMVTVPPHSVPVAK